MAGHSSHLEIAMNKEAVTKDKSLRNFFIIAFLIPIVATGFIILKDGLQTGLVTTQLSPLAMVVVMAQIHAPTIAALIVAFGDEGFEGIKSLFRKLKQWRFKSIWYFRALLIFPLSIFAALLLMSIFSQRFIPEFTFSILVFAVFFSALWEELGWAGYAIPRMLKRYHPLKTAIVFGVIHMFWHLAADYWGASVFFGKLYVVHFFLWMVGLVVLRIVILWMYIRTKSLVLSWLTHFSYTGGQLLMTTTLSAVDTVLWNFVFVLVLLLVIAFLFMRNKDFRDFWKSRLYVEPGE
jgi:membrane protease YdiL (CAAX protease family)